MFGEPAAQALFVSAEREPWVGLTTMLKVSWHVSASEPVSVRSSAVFQTLDWVAFVTLTGMGAAALVVLFAYWSSLGRASWGPVSVLVVTMMLATSLRSARTWKRSSAPASEAWT